MVSIVNTKGIAKRARSMAVVKEDQGSRNCKCVFHMRVMRLLMCLSTSTRFVKTSQILPIIV